MHTIREITRLATMLAGLIAPWIRLGFVSALPQLRLDYALASISCEHCRSSRNNPHCPPRHAIYYLIMILTQLFAFELNKVFLESIIISSTLIHINCVKNLLNDSRRTVTCSKQNMLGSVIRPTRAPPSSPAREIEYYKSYLIKYSTVHF